MKKIFSVILLIICITTIFWCGNNSTYKNYNSQQITTENDAHKPIYINIKYRDSLGDVYWFDSFDTSKSSFIEKAYYDKENQYLILNLNWTYYHWCDVPKYVRDDFKSSDSLWKYYNKYIKWEYDCRNWFVPSY